MDVFREEAGWTIQRGASEPYDHFEPYHAITDEVSNKLAYISKCADGGNSQAVRDLQQEVQSGTVGLGQRMQTSTALITSHIDMALSEPWDQKPIRFQDAIGRRYPVPLEVCGTFEVHSSPHLFCFTIHKVLKCEIGLLRLSKTRIQRQPRPGRSSAEGNMALHPYCPNEEDVESDLGGVLGVHRPSRYAA
jgi:hypothetical protein